MKISLPLLRRRPSLGADDADNAADTPLADGGGVHAGLGLGMRPSPFPRPTNEDEGLGTPWIPSTGDGGPALPPSATVLERSHGVWVAESDRIVHQAAALLLDYPDEELLAQVPVIRDAVAHEVTGAAAAHLLALADHLTATPLAEVQQQYVETFDMRRRCCLHLTYYAYGDTRRRGMALLDLKQTYQRCGATLREDELPDHLCVVLEFSAAVPAVGRTLLLDHRPGLELLRLSLTDRDSVYRHGVEAVCATLPTLVGRDLDAVRTLIASGPPDEQVGMEAYVSGGHMTGMRS